MSETLEDTAPRVTPRRVPVRQNGPAIAAIRELSGWSQNRFAKFVGVSQPTLSAIENEKHNAPATTLSLIAAKLSIPVEAIRRNTALCPACAARAPARRTTGPAKAA